MNKTPILFIINPIAGGKDKSNVVNWVNELLDHDKFQARFQTSNLIGHAGLLAKEAISEGIKLIVAVGGDGTINEVASELVNTDTILGIIPFGSGNGLARFLKIPLSIKKAIELLNTGKPRKIDSGLANGKPFFNIAGLGFDAHISDVFASNKKRGLISYVKIGINEYANYKPRRYEIDIDGETVVETALVISIANSNQYGNDFQISPSASITDGLLDVCILKPIPWYMAVSFFYHLLYKRDAHEMEFLKVIKGKKIRITRDTDTIIHLDGEPMHLTTEINVCINPMSIQIITPL